MSTTLTGCDISNWQKSTPINYEFYIMKATEGVGFIDKMSEKHTAEALKYTDCIGFYHFARPDLGNTAKAEADSFLSVVKDYIGKAVLALDLECVGWGNYVDWTKQWLSYVYQQTGVRPLLYMPGAYAQKFAGIIKDTNTGVWACSSLSYYKGLPVVMTQQVIDNLDRDTFFGDKTAWKKYATAMRISEPIKNSQPKIEKPATSTFSASSILKIGSNCKIRTGSHDLNTGKPFASFVYTKIYTILQINGNRVVFGLNGQVTGVVDASNIITQYGGTSSAQTGKHLTVGARVRIKNGARDLNTGKTYASFVYNTIYNVIQLNGSRVVFGVGSAVTGATSSANVEVV